MKLITNNRVPPAGQGRDGTTNGATRKHNHKHERRQSCRTQRCVYFFISRTSSSRPYTLSSARIAARDAHVRESWVRAMEARIVRDQLQSCYRAEGVNHYESCRELSEKYTTLLKENRVGFFDSVRGFELMTGRFR